MLKEFYQEDNGASQSPKKLYYVAPRRVWNPSQPDMMQGTNSNFQASAQPYQKLVENDEISD